MIYERVVEAVLHSCREILQIVLVKRQGRDNFLVQHLVHEALDMLVVHAVAHDIEAREVCAEYKTGVRAIENAHLALLIRA